MKTADIFLAFAIAAIIGATAYAYYAERQEPTITLLTEEWVCSLQATVRLPYAHQECMEYRRKD